MNRKSFIALLAASFAALISGCREKKPGTSIPFIGDFDGDSVSFFRGERYTIYFGKIVTPQVTPEQACRWAGMPSIKDAMRNYPKLKEMAA
jgi:hypothetical protein